MKQWGSAIFPLSILFVLSLLTFWLRYASELDQPKHDGKHRHDPDYIVGDAKLRKIDVTGALKYTLTAKDMPNALTVIAMAPRGTLLHAPDVYMDKLAIGPGYEKDVVSLDMTPTERVEALARR